MHRILNERYDAKERALESYDQYINIDNQICIDTSLAGVDLKIVNNEYCDGTYKKVNWGQTFNHAFDESYKEWIKIKNAASVKILNSSSNSRLCDLFETIVL